MFVRGLIACLFLLGASAANAAGNQAACELTDIILPIVTTITKTTFAFVEMISRWQIEAGGTIPIARVLVSRECVLVWYSQTFYEVKFLSLI
jgi:hypothetical protein